MGIGLLNYPKFRAEDDNGNPLTGGLLYTYEAGTSTPRASYFDKACTVAHTNPIILDARGEAVIYLSGDYKLILTDSDGVLIWTMDDIRVINPEDIDAFYASINAAMASLEANIELNLATINIRLDALESGEPTSKYLEKVWSFQTTQKEPNYSTAIGPYTVMDGVTPKKAILFCSQNWLSYALDVHTGQVIWQLANDGPMYGRMQAVDLEDNGVLNIYVPCNYGHIRGINAYGSYNAFIFYNVYVREGNGSVTGSGSQYIVDNTKNWHNNAFIRVYQPASDEEAEDNAEVVFTSGAANGQRRRISYMTNGNMLYLYGGRPLGVANGDTYTIVPAYESDTIFMHAGQLIKEDSTWYLYATSQDSHIYKINAHTGDLVWKYAGFEAIEAWPWIGDLFQNGGRYVLWGCYDRHLRCHNATTGAIIWDVELDGLLDGTPQVAPTGINGKYEIYLASRSGKILKINRDNGNVLAESGRPQYWQDVACTARPLKRSDNKWAVYIGGRRGDFGAYDCDDMSIMWKRNVTPDNINSTAAFYDVTGKGHYDIIVADMTGTIHIFHENGRKICEAYGKGAIEGMPLIADIDGDGKVEMVVTTCDGWVHCFRFKNGTDNGYNGECPDAITMPNPPDV